MTAQKCYILFNCTMQKIYKSQDSRTGIVIQIMKS